MAITDGINKFKNKTATLFERRRAALYALSLQYAALALNDFRRRQSNNAFWNNQTGSARDLVFSDAYIKNTTVGWFLAHGVEYGVYLELANDGKNQALRPTTERFAGRFFDDAQSLYKD